MIATTAARHAIADLAVACLELEVRTFPKPGLVSHVDRGSHDDMDARTFRRSAAALHPWFTALSDAGARGAGMEDLRGIGVAAEAAMLAATGGVNTHRGAIFGLGLLCAAAGAARTWPGSDGRATPLGAVVARRWSAGILRGAVHAGSHGQRARRRYGAGGARLEAALGFPSVYDVALPALRSATGEAARVQACFALIAEVEDTNLLHRGGAGGLRFARRTARAFLDRGGVARADWRERARAVHRAFVARRLSPGGSADLLAMSLFVDALEAAR